jgi:hypothetical protein
MTVVTSRLFYELSNGKFSSVHCIGLCRSFKLFHCLYMSLLLHVVSNATVAHLPYCIWTIPDPSDFVNYFGQTINSHS